MALVVAEPPSIVVQTTVKKSHALVKEKPGLCDRFWACVLDDYLDDVLEDDMSESFFEQRQDLEGIDQMPRSGRSRRKRRQHKSKKHSSRHQGRDSSTVLLDAQTDYDDSQANIEEDRGRNPYEEANGPAVEDEIAEGNDEDLDAELETLLSDDVENSEREEHAVDIPSPPSVNQAPVVESPLARALVHEGVLLRTNESLRDQHQGMANNSTQNAQPRPSSTGPYHYAPFPLGSEAEHHTDSLSSPQGQLPSHKAPSYSGGRGSVDHDDDRMHQDRRAPHLVSRDRSYGGAADRPQSRNGQAILPRAPSGMRPTMYTYPTARFPERVERATKSRDTEFPRKVERIDLTGVGEPSNASVDRSWSNGNQRMDTDIRRRKLDRREALHRIRAIKARIQTLDP
eukprot:Nitzschia sp. Nitz4//scaffold17_size182527//123580//124776//NITZ4_001867-RA/size182527-processed-gene-0.64-mRNA-1//-1//CDS//3329539379//4055//frame0